jgi:hypothetical protein
MVCSALVRASCVATTALKATSVESIRESVVNIENKYLFSMVVKDQDNFQVNFYR